MKRVTLAAAFVVSLAGAAAQAAEAKLPAKPGNWQLTMAVESDSLPMKVPPMTLEQCLTESDMIPKAQQANQTCKPANPKVKGNSVTWTIDCVDKKTSMPTKGTGKATYTAESFEGSMEVKSGAMVLSYKLNGKRLGDCKSGATPMLEEPAKK